MPGSAETTIERHRPEPYFGDDVQEASPALLDFAMSALDCEPYRHAASIWARDNFLDSPVNHCAPVDMLSLMLLGTPRESGIAARDLPRVRSPDDWWPTA